MDPGRKRYKTRGSGERRKSMGKRVRIPKDYGEIGIKKDCQMYSNEKKSIDGDCTGLNALYCKYRICQFYKKKKVE